VLLTMRTEGHFVGTSSGAIIHAALTELETNGGTAVMLLPDAGWKYLSGDPWAEVTKPKVGSKVVPALVR